MFNKEGDYVGDFKMNKREGKGIMIYKNESEGTYEGEWYFDQKHGYGVLTIDGKERNCKFVEDKRVYE